MAGVFISYRRADSAGWAGRLFDHLSNRYGNDLVFQDFDDIPPGQDFIEVIQAGIKDSEVMLVVIGPLWLVNAKGERRLDNPDDVLRMEITMGLTCPLTVIPILVGSAFMPSPDDLPEPLKKLSRLNAVEIRDGHWVKDVTELMDHLSQLITQHRATLPLEDAQQEIYAMQKSYFDLLPVDAEASLEIAQEALTKLDQVMPLYPQDSYLQVMRGYFHKNIAMAKRNLNQLEDFELSLNQAEKVFNTIVAENPADASAWNGMGSVNMLRGNLNEALSNIDRALEIKPDYPAALSDRKTVIGHLERNAGLQK